MPATPTPNAHLGPAGEAEWARLRRHLELAERFWLGFVFTPSPPAAAALRERTERHLQSRGRALALFQPEDPDDLRVVWRELHATSSRQAGCVWVEAIRADPPTRPHGPWTNAWEALFLALNEQRETLRRHLSGGLVLVTTPELKPRARELASDLWSIRSLVVDVPGVVSEAVVRHLEIPRSETRSGAGQRGLPLTPSMELRDLRDLVHQVERLLALDDTGAAVEVARDVVALARQVPAARPADLATALAWLSRAEEEHGDLAAAADHVEDALRLADETVDRSTVTELLDRAGRLAERRGDLRRAIAAYRDTAAAARQRLEDDGETSEALRELAGALDQISTVERDVGSSAAAEEALSLRRRLAERSPDDLEALRELSSSLERAANHRDAAEDFSAAAALSEENQLLLRRLVGHDPWAREQLAWGLLSLGRARGHLGHLAAAKAAYEEALALSQRLAGTTGDDRGDLDLVWTSLEWLGDLHAQSGDSAAAAAAYEEALRVQRQFAETVRQDDLPTYQAVWLSRLYHKLAAVRSAAGDTAGADEAEREAAQLRVRLGDEP